MDLIKKIGAVVFALALLVSVALIAQTKVKATGNDVDLQVATAVSTDNGQTWTADTCVPSNTTVQIRTRTWNTGTDDVYQANGNSTVNNGSYLRDCTTTNSNEDGDDYGYTNNPFSGDGEVETGYVAANSTQTAGYQGTITTCRVEAPCEETVLGTVTLTNYNTDDGEPRDQLPVYLFGRALATTGTVSENSTFAVRVAGGVCPNTCGSSTTTTSLPQTGNSVINLVQTLF